MPTTTYDRSHLTHDFEMIDLKAASQVEVVIDQNNKVWVNLNGKCLLRVGLSRDVVISDGRR